MSIFCHLQDISHDTAPCLSALHLLVLLQAHRGIWTYPPTHPRPGDDWPKHKNSVAQQIDNKKSRPQHCSLRGTWCPPFWFYLGRRKIQRYIGSCRIGKVKEHLEVGEIGLTFYWSLLILHATKACSFTYMVPQLGFPLTIFYLAVLGIVLFDVIRKWLNTKIHL